MPTSQRPSKPKSRRKSTAKKPITQKELAAIARKAREAERAAKEATREYERAQKEYRERRKKEKQEKIARRIARTGSRYTKKELQKKEAAKRKAERERIKRYKSRLGQLLSFGIYIPKDSELTAYRKRQINKKFAEFERYLDPTKYFFVKFGDNRTARKRADQMNMITTRKGVFVQKKGGQKKAHIRYDRKLKADVIEVIGYTKKGKRKGRKYREVLPLASIDQLMIEKDRLRKAFELETPLSKGEAVAVGIHDKFSGDEPTWSYQLFTTFDLMWDFLIRYRKTHQQRIELMRHIIFMKVNEKEFARDTLRPQRAKVKHGRVGKLK